MDPDETQNTYTLKEADFNKQLGIDNDEKLEKLELVERDDSKYIKITTKKGRSRLAKPKISTDKGGYAPK